MAASKWSKVKMALGLNLCYYVPRVLDHDSESQIFSDAALLAPPAISDSDHFSGCSLRLSRSSSKTRSAEKTCSICLGTMKPGEGHAIFTAECSHSFHFQCITSNVKHGSQICPVCRAPWKEVPLQNPNLDPIPRKSKTQNSGVMTVVRRLPPSPRSFNRHSSPFFHGTEPAVFDDDESLGHTEIAQKSLSEMDSSNSPTILDLKTYPEVSSVPRMKSRDDFTVLVHLKASINTSVQQNSGNEDFPSVSNALRTPVDLVTVLDISGSMAGTKLALLKRAMGFVIQNLSSKDRLSVIAFSSTARRLFPLRRMSEIGRQQALLAVNSLIANGGTNIAEGLRKAAKVMEERKEKNAVASMILLSDGQDTYTVNGVGLNQTQPNYKLLLPLSIQGNNRSGFQMPVHTFGFGTDHDASSMHSISEISGGTFSFIETEVAIQDAFAQCIGGLLSVVIQNLQVEIDCMHPRVFLQTVKAGSYPSRVMGNGRSGLIDVGHLYADEERDFLLVVNLPEGLSSSSSSDQTPLLKVKCLFKDPFTKETLTIESEEVKISRPEKCNSLEIGSIEVDRQRNRLQAAEAMSQARASAEGGNLGDAIAILENSRKILSTTISGKSKDRLCVALDIELKEMQDRMTSRHVYEASGRAYILSGLSSHSWQRATARGDSTDSTSLIQAYQTPSMVEMLTRSQATLVSSSPTGRRLARPGWHLVSPKPR